MMRVILPQGNLVAVKIIGSGYHLLYVLLADEETLHVTNPFNGGYAALSGYKKALNQDNIIISPN